MQCMILVRLANKLPNRRRSLWFLSFYKLGCTVHWRQTVAGHPHTERERFITLPLQAKSWALNHQQFVGESARALMRWLVTVAFEHPEVVASKVTAELTRRPCALVHSQSGSNPTSYILDHVTNPFHRCCHLAALSIVTEPIILPRNMS